MNKSKQVHKAIHSLKNDLDRKKIDPVENLFDMLRF